MANIKSPSDIALEKLNKKYGIKGTYTPTKKNETQKLSNTTNKPTDYSSAVKYLQDRGVSGASGIMTENEWRRRKKSSGYNTYQDYLDGVVSKRDIRSHDDAYWDKRYREEFERAKAEGALNPTTQAIVTVDKEKKREKFELNYQNATYNADGYVPATKHDDAYWDKRYREEFERAKAEGALNPTTQAIVTVDEERKAEEKEVEQIKRQLDNTEGGYKDSWFKGGAFDDGYDFGDTTKTVLGTVGDLGVGAVKGVGRMVEGLVDLGTYGVAGVADLFGADEFAEKAKDVARYSATDEWTKGTTDFLDQYSVLGNKADALSEGLGQVAAIIATGGLAGAAGLGGAGVTAVTTGVTGLSSMGTNMGEAYNSGATDGEAFVYGLTTGAIEAGTELLSGGLGKGVKALGISRGIGDLDDIFAKKLARKVAGAFASESVQKAVGNTIEFAIKSGGEGFEELLSGAGSAVMKKLTYMDDKKLEELIKDEKLLEQFIVGTVVSSIVQSPSYIKANQTGTDFVTGQTSNQERVVDTIAERVIAERESNGTKLTSVEKNKIYNDVVGEFTNAEVSPDTLEQVARDVVANKETAERINAAREAGSKGVPRGLLNLTTEGEVNAYNEGRQAANKTNRTSTPSYEALEAITKNNETITAEDVKKVTVFGDKGAELVAELANKEGATLSQAERTVKTAYMAGFSNVESNQVSFVTDTQIDAFTAGKQDRLMQDISAKVNAEQKTAESKQTEVDKFKENNTKRVAVGMSAEEGYSYFDSLAEEDGRIHNKKVNNITISIDKKFGGGYSVSTSFYNGDKITAWSVPEEFATFEEAKNYAAMLSYDAAEYDGGLAPIDQYYGRNVSGVGLSAAETSGDSRKADSGLKNSSIDDTINTRNVFSQGGNGYVENRQRISETSNAERNTIGTDYDNDERYSGMPFATESKKLDSEKSAGLDRESGRFEVVERRSGKYQEGTSKNRTNDRNGSIRRIERKTIKEVCDNEDFIRFARFVGDEISHQTQKELIKHYANDERLNEGYDFSDVVAYDMLTNPDNELRGLFSDETEAYFNAEKSSDRDITGKAVDKSILDKLKNTVVKNENGQLIPVYHATNKAFNKFEIGDIGFHFGSYAQAYKRAQDQEYDNPTFIKAYLNITNPLIIEEDFSGWNAFQIAKKLKELGLLTEEEALGYVKASREDKAKNNASLAKILTDNEYDGIVYNNNVESVNGKAYIVFDGSQIIRIDDGGSSTDVTGIDTAAVVDVEEITNTSNAVNDTTDYKEPVETMYDIPEDSEIVNNIVVDEHSKRLKRENLRAYSNIIRMAKRLRMNVRFVKGLTDENGNVLEGLITSKGIFINADAKNPSRFVATHEFGHRMKQAAPKVWAKYQEYVINKLKRESFGNGRTAYDVLYEETKNAYGKDDADSINEEIAVNYAGELFDSEEMLESFIREDKGLALRVRDWWYNVLESMGLLSEKKKAQQLWLKAYTAAAKNVAEGKAGAYSGEKFKYVGETEDGRKIYRTNYKEGTPKSVKQNDLIDVIQNIWSKKPIHLAIKENGVYKEISANFNPELSERSDLSKIVFGNRKGNGSEKRMTLDLSTDLYQIASDAKQTGSKTETGKDNKAHDGVKHWYYFITNLVYEDVNGKRIDCYMNIDVKENQYGHYFYSFAIEKGTAPQTLLAVVSDDMSPTVPTDTTISQDNPSVNSYSMQNTAKNAQEGKKSIAGTRLSELVEKYDAIPKGEKPSRDVQVPRKTAKDKKVSHTVRTILEAKATPDEVLPNIEKMVEDGIFSYDSYTDKQAITDAEEHIKGYGWDESLDDWFDDVEKGVVSKQHTAMGWALYNNAVNTTATTTSETERTTAIKTSLKILDAMVRHQRSAAQALQATRILKKLSPETQLYGVQKSVSTLQKELTDKYGKKAPDLKINEELAEKFLNAKTEDERSAAEIEIYKDIGRQMPSDLLDKWNAWRYTAMLTSLRTHGRNILGNAGFAPVVLVKNLTATAIESFVHRVSGKRMVRGKALVWGSKADKALLKAAWNDYANVADIVSNGGKYNDSAMGNKYIEEGRVIFKGILKPIEAVRKGNSKLLELEDVWFSKPHYAYALAQYCKANNITPEQISRGKAIAPAREYAIKEAQKATYKDTNALSQMVSGWGRNGESKNWLGKAGRTVVEGGLPYRKTPANILVRGIEYSPIGLLKGLTYDLYKIGQGEMSATEAIDNISAGLTGTGLLALGVYLAALGLVRGNGGDDEEKKELMGHQSYSLELPNGQSITLDWLAPESLPFFTGVNIWEVAKGKKEDINLAAILSAINGISDPMLEMSFVQGLNDVFESVGYAKSNDTSALYAILSTAVTSYLSQGIPTVFGQIERTGEENRMTTYTEKNDFLTGDVQYTLGKASAKIPFWDYNQIPYIDAWGRKEASGTALKRGFNNFLNPAYTSTIETSKMEEELLRLYEQTGEGGVFPSRADKYFTVDGVRKDLTADEYVRYATLKGEKSYKLVSDLVKSTAYKKLSDEEKAKAVKEVYDYANQKAKQAISNYKPETWVQKADEFGSNVGNYISFKTEVSGTKEENGGKISKQEVADIILDMAQNDSETWKMYLSMYDSEKDMYAYNKGIGGEDYMDFLTALDRYDKPTDSGKYGTYTQAEATEAINNLKGLSREEKAILWQSVNTSWKKNPFR